MRRLVLASTLVFISSCSESAEFQPPQASAIDCMFQFSAEPICSFKSSEHTIKATLATKRLAENEMALVQANVVANGKQHTLPLSADVSMNGGDIGIMSFADINFDNVPDLAISTSFGVANQYFDYWTYDSSSGKYNPIGNYPKLRVSPGDKTLTANVKLNAASYESQKYSWKQGKLMRRK